MAAVRQPAAPCKDLAGGQGLKSAKRQCIKEAGSGISKICNLLLDGHVNPAMWASKRPDKFFADHVLLAQHAPPGRWGASPLQKKTCGFLFPIFKLALCKNLSLSLSHPLMNSIKSISDPIHIIPARLRNVAIAIYRYHPRF